MIDANAIAQMMQQRQQAQQQPAPAPAPMVRNPTDPQSYAGSIRDRLAQQQQQYFANPGAMPAQQGGIRDMTTLLAKLQERGGFMGGMAGALGKMRGDGSIRDQLAQQQQQYFSQQPLQPKFGQNAMMNRKGGAAQPPAPR